MTFFLIHAECLDQIPATLEILEADRDDRQSLARLLDASIPGSWPPPLLGETLEEFIQTVSEGDDPLFAAWYWVANDPEGGRVLIGAGGTATSPIAQDSVLIGYSVLDEFQGRGYATEAVRHLIPALFALSGIQQIEAAVYPDLGAAIRVLEKNGFVRAGEGFEEGTVRYVLKKPDGSA
ncbi:MAG: GNAT family N-acetyltransferase [Methanoculleus sp.]